MSALTGNETSLFKNRNYLLLFSAQIVSLTGSGVTTVGLAVFAYQMAGGASAAAIIGNALTLRILAFLLFSQPSGVLADRFNRKTILVMADVLRFGLLMLFPLVSQIWHIYVLIFAINAVTAFFTPTFEAMIPEVAGEKHYVKALSLSRVAVDIEALAAPALAGLLLVWLGVRWVFWFDALTYLLSAVLVLMSSIRHVPASRTPFSVHALISELTYGTRVILREASLRQAIVLSFVEATAGAAAIVATVVYVKDVLAHSETAFALVMASLGLGSSMTALILGKMTGRYESASMGRAELHWRRHRWTGIGLIAGGTILGLLLLPGIWQPPLLVFAFLWMLNGAGQALIAIPSTTLLAEHTSEKERGRVYAAHFALTHACWLITYPAIGHGVARFGAPATFSIAGVVCLAITLAAYWFKPFIHQGHTHEP
ncbi:MFS transporter [Oxalobacteraceae bacterium R-40]|uniref:MFS transporter n=1 Tax=Keguizhuia sedimenti TaxID=3064264 RepID=A0ABU1BTH2_9BURK|nr:MFS transporter [Oxalobacteraceae bacterium R-40]